MHTFTYSKIKTSNFGYEQLNKEYKEVFLKNIFDFFSEDELLDFINNYVLNKIKFNKLILQTIILYIKNYLPKYITVFINSNIIGDLYFGIDDIGNTIGIPYFGILDEKLISNTINNIKILLRSYNLDLIDNMLSNIKIEICELEEIDTTKNEFINNLYNFEEINKKINQNWLDYFDKYKIWHKNILKYSVKLSNFLKSDEIRNEIANWIRSYKKINEFKKYDLEKIAKIYENNIFIDKKISIDLIDSIRYNYEHPIKWLIDFKDYKILEIKKEKPLQPMLKPLKDNYSKFCSNIKNILYLLNKINAKFYILKFSIPICNNLPIEYYSEKQSKWLHRSRILINSNPSCF